MTTNPLTSQKVFLKDYQAPHFEIKSTELFFDIWEDKVLVTQKSRYRLFELKPIFLNGSQLTLLSISQDNRVLSPNEFALETDKELLMLRPTEMEFELSIKTKIDPFNNKSLEGLYKSNKYLVTQCEAQGFRKITYFPDRPDIMTSFLVTIEADKTIFPVLLSNGDQISRENISLNRHRVTWKDPWKKPCYLFALFAGDVGNFNDSFTTMSGKKVSLDIYCDHGKESRCLHAMESLKKAMHWDEQVFHREYDLSQYLIVAIDDFNAGAMENKGLNIFNSRLIFADPKTATDLDFFNIESVVAHEYFHNWTGNRITLRDWFQLSLKEGLTVFRDQEFSADMTEKGVQRIKDVDTLKEKQFPEDAGPNAHPVRPDSCYSVDNFFTSTIYEKGAEIIRMMKNLLGKKQFLIAMNNYFNKFDGQAITTDDFRKIILDDSGIMSDIFCRWYEISGTPEIIVNESYNEITKSYTLSIEQKDKLFHFPIFIDFFDKVGNKLNILNKKIQINSDGEKFINLKEPLFFLQLNDLASKPVISFLRNFSSPLKVTWERTLDDLFILANHDDDTFSRRESLCTIYIQLFSRIYKNAKKNPLKNLMELVDEDQDLLSYLKTFSELILSCIRNENLSAIVKSKLLLFPNPQIIIQNIKVLDSGLFQKIENFIKKHIVESSFQEIKSYLLKLKNEISISESAPAYDFKMAAQRELLNNLFELLCFSDQNENLLALLSELKIDHNFNQEINYFKFRMRLLDDTNKISEMNSFLKKWEHEPLVIQKWMQVIADTNSESTFELVQKIYHSEGFNIQNPNQVYSLIRTFGQNIYVFYSKENYWDFYLEVIKRIDLFNPQVAARLVSAFQISNLLPQDINTLLSAKISIFVKNNKLSKNTYELLSKYEALVD